MQAMSACTCWGGVQAVALLEGRLGARHPSVATARNNLGYTYKQMERFDDALAEYNVRILCQMRRANAGRHTCAQCRPAVVMEHIGMQIVAVPCVPSTYACGGYLFAVSYTHLTLPTIYSV